ncbi:hypothetical protein KFE25_011171 [Diacronema lutheri]|uniref:Feruloyl esterase n=2 Tax=Diacronema lutheri TaxID=2081491 RepID=A0A8J5XM63_DIALT|nr:hypothetical protein KFE25_011171 [Diacronema lutheri]
MATRARLGLALALLAATRGTNLCYDDRPRDPGLYDGEIFVAGQRRTYVLYVPKTYDGHTPMPLIINCPNTHVSALEELHQSGLVDDGRGDHYIVVTLNAINKAFNVLEDARASPRGPDDVLFARTLYRYLASRLCVDPARVFATGISRGGRFASRLASEMSDIIAAIGVVSGLRFPQPNNASRPVPVIAFHGTADPINPYEDGGPDYWQTGVEDAVAGWARFNGCRRTAEHRIATSIVKLLHYDCNDNADVVLYKIEGGGHTWPGSTFYYNNQGRLRLGPATLEISASDMMWSFWDRHVVMRTDKNYWKKIGIKENAEIEIASARAEAGARRVRGGGVGGGGVGGGGVGEAGEEGAGASWRGWARRWAQRAGVSGAGTGRLESAEPASARAGACAAALGAFALALAGVGARRRARAPGRAVREPREAAVGAAAAGADGEAAAAAVVPRTPPERSRILFGGGGGLV